MQTRILFVLATAFALTALPGAARADDKWGAICEVDAPGAGQCLKRFRAKPSEEERCSCTNKSGRRFTGRLYGVLALTPDGDYSVPTPPPPTPSGRVCERPPIAGLSWDETNETFIKDWDIEGPTETVQRGLTWPALDRALQEACSIKTQLIGQWDPEVDVSIRFPNDVAMEVGDSGPKKVADQSEVILKACGIREVRGSVWHPDVAIATVRVSMRFRCRLHQPSSTTP